MPIRLGEPTLFLTNWADCPFLQPLPHRVETLTFESCLLIISLARSLARPSSLLARSLASIIRYSLDFNQSGEENSYIIAYYYYYCLLIIYLLLEEIKNNKGSSGATSERGGTTAVVATLFFLFETCVALPACSTFRGRGVRGGESCSGYSRPSVRWRLRQDVVSLGRTVFLHTNQPELDTFVVQTSLYARCRSSLHKNEEAGSRSASRETFLLGSRHSFPIS